MAWVNPNYGKLCTLCKVRPIGRYTRANICKACSYDSRRKKTSATLLAYGARHSTKRPEVRMQMSVAASKRYENPVERAIKSRLFSVQKNQPTKPELLIYSKLDKRSWKLVSCTPAKEYNGPISFDIINPVKKIGVLHHGCFWHECPKHGKGYYPSKPANDAAKIQVAKASGWQVFVIWQHEVYDSNQLARAVAKLTRLAS